MDREDHHQDHRDEYVANCSPCQAAKTAGVLPQERGVVRRMP